MVRSDFMVDLRRIQYKTMQLLEGSTPKSIVITDNGKYVFKANFGYRDKGDLPTSFGEVFYSEVCKTLGCNCVNVEFAKMELGERLRSGTLIDYFWEEDTLESLSYGEIALRCNLFGEMDGDEMVVDKILTLTKSFAKNNGLKYNEEESRASLIKLTILDYFFAQADRHFHNIEFLVSEKEMKLAPIFDNGYCFNLWRSMSGNEIDMPKGLRNIGSAQYLRINRQSLTGTGECCIIDLVDQISKVVKNDKEMRHFVEDIYRLDIDSLLKKIYDESEKDFNYKYVTNCADVFNYRKNLLKNYYKEKYTEDSKNFDVDEDMAFTR